MRYLCCVAVELFWSILFLVKFWRLWPFFPERPERWGASCCWPWPWRPRWPWSQSRVRISSSHRLTGQLEKLARKLEPVSLVRHVNRYKTLSWLSALQEPPTHLSLGLFAGLWTCLPSLWSRASRWLFTTAGNNQPKSFTSLWTQHTSPKSFTLRQR